MSSIFQAQNISFLRAINIPGELCNAATNKVKEKLQENEKKSAYLFLMQQKIIFYLSRFFSTDNADFLLIKKDLLHTIKEFLNFHCII